MQHDDLPYLGHLLDTARQARSKVEEIDRATFDADENLRLALAYLIQIIGEAARQVSDEGRATMTTGREAIVLGPGETRRRLDRTIQAAIKVGAEETGGAYMLRVADAVPPGRWVPAHIHHREEEAWYVLGGVLTFRIGGRTVEAPTGAFILVPRGMVHSFGNDGASPAAYLQVFSPAGIEGYFEGRAALQEAALHEASLRGQQTDYAGLDAAAHAALAKKYHLEFV